MHYILWNGGLASVRKIPAVGETSVILFDRNSPYHRAEQLTPCGCFCKSHRTAGPSGKRDFGRKKKGRDAVQVQYREVRDRRNNKDPLTVEGQCIRLDLFSSVNGVIMIDTRYYGTVPRTARHPCQTRGWP